MQKARFICLLAMMIVAVGSVKADPTGSWSDSDNRDTSWGSDYAEATEFTITTPEQLAQFAYMVNNGSNFSGKSVTLNQREEIEEYPYGEQVWTYNYYDMRDHYWTPIGTATNQFKGTFNGNGVEVNYLKINDEDATYQGFFGYIGEGGNVISTTVRISTIIAASQVGAIAGYNGGTMANCVVTDNTITGTSYAGAIVGQNAGTMTNCYGIACKGSTKAIGVNGSATGEDVADAGQCLWTITGNNIEVSKGTPTGTTVGSAVFYDDGIQYNSYHYYKTGATAFVTYTNPGYVATFSVIGIGASIDDNVVTVGTSNVTVTSTTTVAEWSGKGSADEPYLIYTREQLEMLATRVNNGTSTYEGNYFRLEEYINYGYTSDDYSPIGTVGKPFNGTFDGNGNEIRSASNSTENFVGNYQGLFGYIGTKGTVKNLSASSCTFTGCGYVGVIAGFNAGTIENCRVDGRSGACIGGTATYQYYGGVAGYNAGTVKTTVCAANVRSGFVDEVLASGYTVSCSGGIVGYNAENALVENCLYLGRELMGSTYVGAIVGQNAGVLTHNFYHQNGYTQGNGSGEVADHIGTDVLGVGVSGGLTGADAVDAAKAKVVILPDGGTFSNPCGATIDGTPTYVTTSNPHEIPLSVYTNGLLFDDGYIGSEMENAFYTTGATINLVATNVPDGYAATFSTESDGASVSGNTLTIGSDADVIEVSVSAQRVPTGWLADDVRATSFSTQGENSITIMNAAELGLLAYNVNFSNQSYDGYTVTLGSDINLAGKTWVPIGYSGTGYEHQAIMSPMPMPAGLYPEFLGTFDGDGHVISNLNSGNYGGGLFSSATTIVKNVIIKSPVVKGAYAVGAIAGSNSGSIQNCHIVDGSVSFEPGSDVSIAMYFGGITGLSNGTVSDCSVIGTAITGCTTDTNSGVGGVVGLVTTTFDNDNNEVPAVVSNNIFGGLLTVGDEKDGCGSIVGSSTSIMSMYSPSSNVVSNTITGNYYLSDNIGGVRNADTDGAKLAMQDDANNTPFITLMATRNTYVGTNNAAHSITLNGRTLYKDGNWNTLCLPFNVNSFANTPLAGAVVKELGNSDGCNTGYNSTTSSVHLDFVEADEIEAGHAYIVKWETAADPIVNPVFNNVTVVNENPNDQKVVSQDETVEFIGYYSAMPITAANSDIWYMTADNTLKHTGVNRTLHACRAYFRFTGAAQNASRIVLDFGDDATGIGELKNENRGTRNDVVYDLSGRKVSGSTATLKKGVYILNGRTVVVK